MTLLELTTWATLVIRAAICVRGIALSHRMLTIYQNDMRDFGKVDDIVHVTIESSLDVGHRMVKVFYVLAATVVFSICWQVARPLIYWWGLIGAALTIWVTWQILQMKVTHASGYKEKLQRALRALARADAHKQERQDDADAIAVVARQHHEDMTEIGRKIDVASELTAKAFSEANHAKEEIQKTNKHIESLLGTHKQNLDTHTETLEQTATVATDTNETVHRIDEKVATLPEKKSV